MRKLLTAVGVIAGLCLAGSPAALAAQEIGDRCAANDAVSDWTAIVLNNNEQYGVLPPLVPPEGAKVITGWKVNAPLGIEPIAQQLVALKQVGEEADLKVGESAVETVVGGAANRFATRIPVPEYAHVGLRGPVQTLFCDKEAGHIGGIVEGPWATGEQRKFKTEAPMGVPVVAFVEADRDADGYGDETQDGCPSLAFLQTPCPLRIAATAKATKAAILLTVSTGPPARVFVSGKVVWSVKPKAGGKRKQLSAGLGASPQDVGYEVAGAFTVTLPKAVKRRLAKLPPKQSLKARLHVEAINPSGDPATTQNLIVKLPGRRR